MRCSFIVSVCMAALLAPVTCSAEEVFSGPQVGEKLAPFQARGVFGELAGKEFDLVQQADGKPLAIVFVHEVTRPSIGLTRLIMNWAAERSEDGLTSGVVFLSDDATETENLMKRAAHALPQGVPLGISLDGREGPGAYGLNRNVTLTFLVGKENEVTANFALVQPSVQADTPKIVKAIADALGDEQAPTLVELDRYGRADERMRGPSPELQGLLRRLIQKDASQEDVAAAAAEIEKHFAEHPEAKEQVAQIGQRIIRAGKLEDYGTPAAQAHLKKWVQQHGKREAASKDR